ncbi:MAG: PAS domain S-box protein, partial [Archaeoglobaceae archaeon]|nr:PAS domain S-box protein [Archaeoglobaceae archaeon]
MELEVEMWKNLMDMMLTGVFISDESLKHLYVNDIFSYATGYSKDELKEMKVFDLVYKDDIEKAKKIVERVLRGEVILDEIRYVTKDGKVRWVYGLYRPFYMKGKLYTIGNYIDITRVKRLEEKLKESEEFYRMLVDKSFAGIQILQKGKIVFLNRSAVEGSGYDEDELMRMDPF